MGSIAEPPESLEKGATILVSGRAISKVPSSFWGSRRPKRGRVPIPKRKEKGRGRQAPTLWREGASAVFPERGSENGTKEVFNSLLRF